MRVKTADAAPVGRRVHLDRVDVGQEAVLALAARARARPSEQRAHSPPCQRRCFVLHLSHMVLYLQVQRLNGVAILVVAASVLLLLIGIGRIGGRRHRRRVAVEGRTTTGRNTHAHAHTRTHTHTTYTHRGEENKLMDVRAAQIMLTAVPATPPSAQHPLFPRVLTDCLGLPGLRPLFAPPRAWPPPCWRGG